MKYFGTNLDTAGHYTWDLEGNSMRQDHLPFSQWPFELENYPVFEKGEERVKGTVKFYTLNGYSVCAIYGSCYDKRGGTRSVFFIKKPLTNSEMKAAILSIPIAKRMIEQMPFKVDWDWVS